MTVTPTPSIDNLPDAPQRTTDAPAAYVPKADAHMAALPTFGAQIQAVGAAAEANAAAAEAAATTAEAAAAGAIAASDYVGTTTAALNVTTGSQSFTTQAGLSFSAAASHQVVAVCLTDSTLRLTGTVTAYNSGSGATTVNFTSVRGAAASGTGWVVMLKAFEGLSPEEVDEAAAAFAIVL